MELGVKNKFNIFCPDNAEGRTKVLNLLTEDKAIDLQTEEWERIGNQGGLSWWKMIKKSSGVILHGDPFIGYEVGERPLIVA